MSISFLRQQVAISYGEIGLAKGGINDYLLIMFLLGGVLSFCFAVVQYAAAAHTAALQECCP